MDGMLEEVRCFGIQSLVDQIEKLKLAEEQKKSDVSDRLQVCKSNFFYCVADVANKVFLPHFLYQKINFMALKKIIILND